MLESVLFGWTEAVAALLAAGATPDARDVDRRTPLHVAADGGDVRNLRQVGSRHISSFTINLYMQHRIAMHDMTTGGRQLVVHITVVLFLLPPNCTFSSMLAH